MNWLSPNATVRILFFIILNNIVRTFDLCIIIKIKSLFKPESFDTIRSNGRVQMNNSRNIKNT